MALYLLWGVDVKGGGCSRENDMGVRKSGI
jgi:hypothetical protein